MILQKTEFTVRMSEREKLKENKIWAIICGANNAYLKKKG